MNATDKGVDVLGVLDNVIDHAINKPDRNCGTLCGLALEEARAAVAELIEAGKFLATNPLGMITPGALNRWNAALARCGVAK